MPSARPKAGWLLICLVLLVGFASTVPADQLPLLITKARLGQANLVVELASSPAQHYQGLSDRTHLGPGRGMLFLYPSPRPLVFVMRRMHFPLDFVWIKQGKVMGLNHDVPAPRAGEQARTIASPGPVDWVLEVNAGWVRANRIAVGDTITLGE